MGGNRRMAMALAALLLVTVALTGALAESDTDRAAPPAGDTMAPEVTVLNKHEVQGVLGRDVRSPTDENMGRVVDVLVDREGQVRAAIIDFGGFLGVGAAATFLMYHLWGYPYDKETLHSSAPRGLIRLHRVLGYVYVMLYVYFLVQMVPRLWNYQIEFPARTVVHITLGMVIGVILVIKLAIVRFFPGTTVR